MTCSARPTGGGDFSSSSPGNRSCLADPWAVLNRPFRPGPSFGVLSSMFDVRCSPRHLALKNTLSAVLSCPLVSSATKEKGKCFHLQLRKHGGAAVSGQERSQIIKSRFLLLLLLFNLLAVRFFKATPHAQCPCWPSAMV